MVGCSGKTDKDATVNGVTTGTQSDVAGTTENENNTLDKQEPDDGYAVKYTRVLDGNESVDEYSYDENGNVIYTKDSGSDDSKCTYVNVSVTPEQQEKLNQEKSYL